MTLLPASVLAPFYPQPRPRAFLLNDLIIDTTAMYIPHGEAGVSGPVGCDYTSATSAIRAAAGGARPTATYLPVSVNT